MHLEIIVGAVGEQIRAARPEVDEPCDILLRRQVGCLVKVDCEHACSFLGSVKPSELVSNPGNGCSISASYCCNNNDMLSGNGSEEVSRNCRLTVVTAGATSGNS